MQLFMSGKVSAFLKSVGAMSLELYLTHITLQPLLKGFFHMKMWTIQGYGFCILLSVIISILLHKWVSGFYAKNILKIQGSAM